MQIRYTICSKAKKKSYQVHQELQMEVEQSKLYQSGQSLNLQLNNLRNLQKELSQAEQALQRLGNLSALADCMIVQNLVTISKQEVNSFLNNVLKVRQKIWSLNWIWSFDYFKLYAKTFDCFNMEQITTQQQLDQYYRIWDRPNFLVFRFSLKDIISFNSSERPGATGCSLPRRDCIWSRWSAHSFSSIALVPGGFAWSVGISTKFYPSGETSMTNNIHCAFDKQHSLWF